VSYPISISDIAERCYANSKAHGFWENGNDTMPLKLMLIVTELAEAMEAYRTDDSYEERLVEGKPEGLVTELADAIIRIFDLAEGFGLDIEQAIHNKMAYNEGRSYMHGGKKA
jgi:NTP pyrophosphatase (non-canonical NTP hydrolase)